MPNEFVGQDGKQVTNMLDIVNGFNDFFVNVGPDLAKNIPCEPDKTIFNYLKGRNANSIFLAPVLEQEVINITRNCKNKTSNDYNGLSMQVVKRVMCSVSKPFTYICNLSFEQGVFPRSMKTAKVIPIFKSGETSRYTNYRPVSILPQFSKILERLFVIRIDEFIERCEILNDSQYGFRSGYSTNMALINLIESITTSIDKKKCTVGVFVDLKKAFDTINHSLLLKKLDHYGVRGAVNDWVATYLQGRNQFVQVDDCFSQLRNIKCGVPQGSVLGTKLFILYINDLCNVTRFAKMVLFADDTNIFLDGDDVNSVCERLNSELEMMHAWFNVNKLSLNTSKTNFMVFGGNKQLLTTRIVINKIDIDRVKYTKFLGVFMDEKLTWHMHIDKTKSKLARCIGIICKGKEYLNCDALLSLYKTLFMPHLIYCVEVWGNTYPTKLKPLYSLQSKAVRIIFNLRIFDSTTELFHKLGLLKLYEIVEAKTCTVMYKAAHNLLPVNIQCFFKQAGDHVPYVTRQNRKFQISYTRTSLKAMCLSVCGPKIWNKLPKTVTSAHSIGNFKIEHKKLLLTKYAN